MSRTPTLRYPLILLFAGFNLSLAALPLLASAEDLPPPPPSGSQAPMLPDAGMNDMAQPSAPPIPDMEVPPPASSSETTSGEKPPPSDLPSPAAPADTNTNTSVTTTRATEPTDNSRPRKGKDYSSIKPEWAISLDFSPSALGGGNIAPIQAGITTRAFAVAGEYQPAVLQDFGIFGIGASFGLYPMIPTLIQISAPYDPTQPVSPSNQPPPSSPNPNNFSNWKLGIQLRYQARFVREQLIVPTVAFLLESINYAFNDNSQGQLTALGPSLGVMLLLNTLDPDSAADFYFNHGVTRSYFTVDVRLLSGSDAVVNFSGPSLFFGLRIEL